MSEAEAGLLTGRRLVLWRHGRTQHNVEERFQGHLDTALDDIGRCQAAAAANDLAGQAPSVLLASDLSRTAETAAELEQRTGLVATLDRRLREHDVGPWTGLTYRDVAARFPAPYREWQEGGYPQGWEDLAAVAKRALECIRPALMKTPRRGAVVVVSHGGTIRAVIGSLLGLDIGCWWKLAAVDNCHWSTLAETSRGWHLVEYNIAACMPKLGARSASAAGRQEQALRSSQHGATKEGA